MAVRTSRAPSPRGLRMSESEIGTGGRTPSIRVLAFLILVVGALAGVGVVARFLLYGNLTVVYATLSVFLCVNLLICFWEVCLVLRHGVVAARVDYWRRQQLETGRSPHAEFFTARIPWTRILSPTVWADVWATYAQYDPAFADRRTFGFNVDAANGLFTPVPTLVLYVAFATEYVPAWLTGMIGLMLFWQWTYTTSVYLASFFVAGRHRVVGRRDVLLYVVGTNAPWILCPLAGLYVAYRLIADGSYAVLGG